MSKKNIPYKEKQKKIPTNEFFKEKVAIQLLLKSSWKRNDYKHWAMCKVLVKKKLQRTLELKFNGNRHMGWPRTS